MCSLKDVVPDDLDRHWGRANEDGLIHLAQFYDRLRNVQKLRHNEIYATFKMRGICRSTPDFEVCITEFEQAEKRRGENHGS